MGTNTGIGIGIGIPFKNFSSGGRQPLPPDLKASLKGVWIAYGKSNNDADRSIVKNLVDLDNPFIISNAAFKLNSGFGKYETELSNTRIWTQSKETTSSPFSSNYNGLSGWIVFANTELTNSADMPSFKIQVKGLLEGQELIYRYYDSTGQTNVYSMTKDGEYTLPADVRTAKPLTSNTSGFQIVKNETNIITITQIPSFEGAFVTDGIDDLITSTKTVQEMLGGSSKITVVSMIHQIELNKVGTSFTNYCRKVGVGYVRNETRDYGTTGIYGWSISNVNNSNSVNRNLINNILGDKELHSIDSVGDIANSIFSLNGYINASNSPSETSQLAWYWTFIANRVLTTDEINQVIAYYNLDRTLRPDILCNITKQGITNDNHADFNDKLIDYSGNGRDIQMYNLAWKGGSGVAAKQYETFKDWTSESSSTSIIKQIDEFTRIVESTTNGYWVSRIRRDYDLDKVYDPINVYLYQDNNFLVHECKYEVDGVKYAIPINEPVGKGYHKLEIYTKDRYTKLPENAENVVLSEWYFPKSTKGSIKYSIIPSCKGGLLLDGVNDFGQFVGDLGLKDYTLIMNRAYNNLINNQVPLVSSNIVEDQTPFIVEHWNTGSNAISFSYGASCTTDIPLDINKKIVYQSTYSYMGYVIPKGNAISTGGGITLGKFGNGVQYSAICLWSLMLFPYSLSEFLIERQLKKHKLGTLYPDMVEFRPVIKANANYKITYYQIDSTNTWKSIKVGDYIVIGAKLAFQITFDNDASELKEVVSPQLSGIIVEKRPSNPGYNIYSYITSKSPQKINITIDEYIRFEDIVQPYPVLLRFKDENGNEVSWGGKFKVGSTITRIGSAADSNLLPNIYNIFGLLLNGNQVTSSKVIVEKTMVFKAKSAYIFDNNEPNCILSPRLLRIPNSSYKILGYIPDISGHGNNGVIHNSAYAEGSGVNEDGSYQFDGVDDFVTIPTTVGGKQVLMKVNNNTINSMLYDQRSSGASPNSLYNDFAIYCTNIAPNNLIAYQSRLVGNTYIDGILNTNITCEDLLNVLHNITITCDIVAPNNRVVPYIGVGGVPKNLYSKVALYDFMLFDNISTDDKIKELNEYVGIEAKVELPPYYWDAYGKTNLDGDKATIQQRGVAVGDYDLTNNNLAYDKMSGFGGYEFEKFTDTTKWIETKREDGIEVIEKNDYSFTAKKVGTGQYFWDFKNNTIKTLDRDLTVKAISNNNVYIRWEFKYRTAEKPDIDSAIILLRQAMTPNVPITVTLPYKTQEEQTELGVVEGSTYYLFYFDPLDIPVGDEYTVEMLPLYPNGLVYDGITNYSKNANIPALDDFTAIIKREWLKKQGSPLIKGSKVYEGGNGNALLLEWDKAYNFVFYKRTDIMEGELPDNISFITPTNYNGNVITRGSEQDTNGICIAGDGNAGFANMVFYKLILYPKTIPLLQINFLKNLMERDEIIDLNNPIFIKNE